MAALSVLIVIEIRLTNWLILLLGDFRLLKLNVVASTTGSTHEDINERTANGVGIDECHLMIQTLE